MIGGVSVVLPFGSIYSLFDTKKLYIVSVVIFSMGSALCGAAPTLDAFIVGRAIAGMGGIGQRGLVFGIGNVAGPVIGGAFAESKATWRWGFYVNLCIIGLLSPVYLFLIPSFRPQRNRSILSRLRDLDQAGTVLSIGCLVCLVMAINFGGTLYRWDGAHIIVLFVLSGIIFIAFAAQQYFTLLTDRELRLFPVFFLQNKESILLFVLTATFNSAGFIPIYYIPTYFQFTRGDDPVQSAVRLLPLIVSITLLVLINGGALSRGGYYMPWFLVGSILSLVGGVVFCEHLQSLLRDRILTFAARIDATTSTGSIYGFEVLLGIGTGCGMQAAFAVIQTITKPELVTSGLSFIMIAQLLGVSLALSISGAVFVNRALGGLEQLLVGRSRSEIQAALLGLSGDFLSTLDPREKTQALDVIIRSLSNV
ncbi:MAG: hypothetical protein Q9226_007912 [Calogaya cf. arnoldii]